MSLVAVQRVLAALALALGDPSTVEVPKVEVHGDIVVLIEPAKVTIYSAHDHLKPSLAAD